MRIISLSCLLFFLPFMLSAQSSKNYLTVDLQNSLQFVLNDSWDIEHTKTVNNAIKITLRSQGNSCHVYAKVNQVTGNTSTPLSPGYFKIKFNSSTAGTKITYLNSQDITLSYTNQLLFQQKKNGGTRYYYYDFMLAPLGYDFNPGNYSFSILFTMSQP